jgi:hypothetical protein
MAVHPLTTYSETQFAGEEDIPNLAISFNGVPTNTPNNLNTQFIGSGQVQSPVLTQFAFSPDEMFSTTTSYRGPTTSNATVNFEYYTEDGGYYRSDNWQNTANGSATQNYPEENSASYYYAPIERGQPNQYDDRDRSSPPDLQHSSYPAGPFL